MSITSEPGTIVALGRTRGRLGSRLNSIARPFHTRSIWRLRGALSRCYLIRALSSPRVHSGNLNERFWLRIDGYRTITSLVIAYICSVRWKNI
jgi:hypothetical protein